MQTNKSRVKCVMKSWDSSRWGSKKRMPKQLPAAGADGVTAAGSDLALGRGPAAAW